MSRRAWVGLVAVALILSAGGIGLKLLRWDHDRGYDFSPAQFRDQASRISIGMSKEQALTAVAEAVRGRYAGRTVLVVGHSNTVSAIIAALGGPAVLPPCDNEFANLWMLVLPPAGAVTERLSAVSRACLRAVEADVRLRLAEVTPSFARVTCFFARLTAFESTAGVTVPTALGCSAL